jgi:hypothetical protein
MNEEKMNPVEPYEESEAYLTERTKQIYNILINPKFSKIIDQIKKGNQKLLDIERVNKQIELCDNVRQIIKEESPKVLYGNPSELDQKIRQEYPDEAILDVLKVF